MWCRDLSWTVLKSFVHFSPLDYVCRILALSHVDFSDMPDHMIRAELNLPIEEQEVAPPASTEGEEESKEDITDVVTDKATDEAVATT